MHNVFHPCISLHPLVSITAKRGYLPNVARNSTINAAELASYDQLKQTILRMGVMDDGVGAHLASGAGAGFIATVVGSPVDVLKTRMMSTVNGVRVYNSISDCIAKSFRSGGISTFYQGFWANFARIGSWNIIMFMVLSASFDLLHVFLILFISYFDKSSLNVV
jgi:solute carrier family 25 uncoupling protein 8/9